MRILFVADGRSPIAHGWIKPLIARGHAVHLVTTFPSEPIPGLQSYHPVGVGFSTIGRRRAGSVAPPGGAGSIGLRSGIKHWLGPLTVFPAAQKLRRILGEVETDIVHALRIPFEGILCAQAHVKRPLVVSVWGNDFTLHAQASPAMRWLTRSAVRNADALHADCHRDIRLAYDWGLGRDKPTTVLPGGGGIDREIFRPGDPLEIPVRKTVSDLLAQISPADPVVINPRGFRAYVRNDTFFKSLPGVLEKQPSTHFLMVGMAGEERAEEWLRDPELKKQAHLLPTLTPSELAALYRRAWVMVSPSEHDGTPNSFLEAIASGCFPIVGDLESLREWVVPGQNGELIDPGDHDQLARAISAAIESHDKRARAQALNQEIIDERAARTNVTQLAEAFYEKVLTEVNGSKNG